MATLENIRKRGKIVMVVVFVALLCFIIGDFLSNSSAIFNQDRDQIGEVCGKKMNYGEFQKEVDAFTNFNKMEGINANEADVRTEAWQTFVISNMLEDQMNKIGMSITPEELEYATNENPHRDLWSLRILKDENGNFSPQRLRSLLKAFKQLENADEEEENNPNMEYIKNMYNGWLCVEKKLINSMAYEKLISLTANATETPKAEKDFIAKYAADEIEYVSVYKPNYMTPDSTVTVSESEGKAEYEKIKKMFKTDDFRSIKAIVFDVRPGEEDSLEAKDRTIANEKELKQIEDIEEAYLLASQESDPNYVTPNVYLRESEIDYTMKEFAFCGKKDSVIPTFEDGLYYKTGKVLSNIVTRPDSIKISLIYLAPKEKNENVKAKADSIFGAIKAGASFGEMAEKFSMDGSSSKNKGEFGWLKEGIFSGFKDFDETAFNGKEGQVFQIGEKGMELIVKIDSMTAPVRKVKIAEIAIKIEAGTNTYRKYYEQASKYVSDNSNLDDFVNNAAAEGVMVNEYSPIFENDNAIRGGNFENARKIVSWAFKHNVGEITSQPFETPNQCIVAAVTGIIEKGYLPYTHEYVKNTVEKRVMDEKKSALTIEEWKGKEISECGERLDTIRGARFDVNYQDPIVLANISLLNENESSEPIKGMNGVYKVKVLSKKPVEEAAPTNRRREMEMLFRQSMQMLIEKTDIVDKRSNFF